MLALIPQALMIINQTYHFVTLPAAYRRFCSDGLSMHDAATLAATHLENDNIIDRLRDNRFSTINAVTFIQ